jgi:hypothetical protein
MRKGFVRVVFLCGLLVSEFFDVSRLLQKFYGRRSFCVDFETSVFDAIILLYILD